MRYIVLLFTAAFILYGCSSGSDVYYEFPVEFRFPEKKNEFISKYSPYLSGKKIFIDPGHGGTDRKNKGPQGITTEADANLRVALALRDLLIAAGARTEMSRDADFTVDLKERSNKANKSGADIFISIHHNAPGTQGDNWTNYTSTYYHASEEDYEYEPNERDLARYVQRDLAYAMRNSGGPGSFDGTYSDYTIYPKEGFSVLRLTEIPAILVECGFHTNLHEERRLSIEEFNKIQAWGIFKGIAKYFAAGIPTIQSLDNASYFEEGDIELNFLMKDSSGINESSIQIFIDSLKADDAVITKEQSDKFKIHIPMLEAGNHIVKVTGANKNKNHALPFSKEIFVLKK